MSIMFRAVIFDFDGVVADTMNDNYLAWRYAFSNHNILIEKKDYFLLEGMGPKSIANHFLSENGIDKELSKNIIFEKEQYYLKHNKFKIYPEIRLIFDLLTKNKVEIAIVTGASRERISNTLEESIIQQTSVIITSNDVLNTKPHPEPYLLAIKNLKIESQECLVIENAILGIKSAKAAECLCFAIETTLDKTSLNEADNCFRNHSQLLTFFKNNYFKNSD